MYAIFVYDDAIKVIYIPFCSSGNALSPHIANTNSISRARLGVFLEPITYTLFVVLVLTKTTFLLSCLRGSDRIWYTASCALTLRNTDPRSLSCVLISMPLLSFEICLRSSPIQEERSVINSTESSKVYRSKLMLYLPWRNEDDDILGGYRASPLEEAVDHLNQHGPPLHAWPLERKSAESMMKHKKLSKRDALNRKTLKLMHSCSSSSSILHHFCNASELKLAGSLYRRLNKKRQVVSFHRKWNRVCS